ncbi:MAG: haloacid dehalogenase type II [Burkholderiaceae bacterium]|nr:MAG: haloacid dehalogenase type II [Burkholderiaceae bacterium]
MTLQTQRISAITVDSYSTLLDVDSAAGALNGIVADSARVAAAWRQQSLIYATTCNFIGHYRTFYELNRAALVYALAREGLRPAAPDVDRVLAIYHDLQPFGDVRTGIAKLRDMGYPVWVVSNGDPDMLQSLVRDAHIEDVVSGIVSAHEIRRYKPAAEIYQHAARRIGQPTWALAHASAAWFDVAGAMHAGMQGVWMNRKDEPAEVFGPFPPPDLTVSGFNQLIAALD